MDTPARADLTRARCVRCALLRILLARALRLRRLSATVALRRKRDSHHLTCPMYASTTRSRP